MNQGDNDGGRVAGSYTMSAQLPNGKQLTLSGYILADDGLDDLNRRLDVAAQVVERQRVAAEIPELEAKLQQREDQLNQMLGIIEELSGKDKLSSRETENLRTMKTNLKMVNDNIEAGKAALAKSRKISESLAA
jgi:TolA-binding protein